MFAQGARTPLIMGIVNVTPDSFSDGGQWDSASAAIDHAFELASQGAQILDIGGESTRPGAARVSAEEELRRVIPVVQSLAREGVAVSVDTMRAATARAAVEAGARLINDVSGGLADPLMAATIADLDVDFVAMHWRAHSTEMDGLDSYDDVVADVRRELAERVVALEQAGVDPQRIILDPGLGFSKVGESNWPLLAHLDSLTSLGYRVLVGASRKRFLGSITKRADLLEPPPAERDFATTAVTTLAAISDAWAVRVHNVSAACDAIAVANAWLEAKYPQE